MSDTHIRHELLNSGWPEAEIDLHLLSTTQAFDIATTGWSHQTILILSLCSVFVIAGGLRWFLLARHPVQTSAVPLSELTYVNYRFGYEVRYKDPWRLANSYSERYAKGLKSLSLIERSAPTCIPDESRSDSATDAFENCVRRHPELNNIESQYREYSGGGTCNGCSGLEAMKSQPSKLMMRRWFRARGVRFSSGTLLGCYWMD
jgi:hypothetical protein